MRDSVKLISAALDELEGGEIILRGVIDNDSLALLQVGDYQREVLPMARINDLIKGMDSSSVPDIDLGMRGGDYSERDNAFYLKDPVFIVDGLQRRTAALEMLKRGLVPRLGATVHFNTNEALERERFKMLNVSRVKLSANVLIRNMRDAHVSVNTLYNLSHDTAFVLNGRVCWNQNMKREHILTAMTLVKVVGHLSGRFVSGTKSHLSDELAQGLDKALDCVSRKTFREIVLTFFDIVDECWGVKSIVYKESAIYMRASFLEQLARVFTDHTNFWEGSRLVVASDLRKKIALFPVNDPTVMNLAAATGQARKMLYQLMVDHINSGKRTRRLTRFGASKSTKLAEEHE